MGAVVRVFLIPGPRLFQLVVAAILLPLGIWLCLRGPVGPRRRTSHGPDSQQRIMLLGLAVGVIGGIYGIGGGSLLSPILVGRGSPVSVVAPAALTSTFVTSVAGAATYMVLALTQPDLSVVPHWTVGIAAGVGGLLGGYLGAALQPFLPERVLSSTLGVLAIATAVFYSAQALN